MGMPASRVDGKEGGWGRWRMGGRKNGGDGGWEGEHTVLTGKFSGVIELYDFCRLLFFCYMSSNYLTLIYVVFCLFSYIINLFMFHSNIKK